MADGDDRLFVTASTENAAGIFALDPSHGSEKWRVLVDSPPAAPPAVGANHVYASLADGRVLALQRQHGGQQWEWDVSDQAPGQPVVAGNSVSVTSPDAGLVALAGQLPEGTEQSAERTAVNSTSGNDSTTGQQASDDDGSDGFGPGFGILASVAGVGRASYLYDRRSDASP